MAKPIDIPKPVVCEDCGKIIQPDPSGIVTKCVWRDGKTLCFECNKRAARGASK